MKASTLEWINKAEGDWDVAQRVYRARIRPNYDSACFHIQQCLEKYLKARLNEAWIVPPKTHVLGDLLTAVLPTEPAWAPLKPVLDQYSKYAVITRYPGYDVTKSEAAAALKDCRELRRIFRHAFGLPV